MNKYIIGFAIFQIFIPLSSKAIYTIKSVPSQLENYYHINYELTTDSWGELPLNENGVLHEKITIPDPESPNKKYSLNYIYTQDKNKNSFSFNLFTDHFFKIQEEVFQHPILFYLHNIRSGLQTEFSGVGSDWCSSILDNKHTYLDFDPNKYKKKVLNVHYEVKNIEEPQFDSPKIYTIHWNALGVFSFNSRRHGEIVITSDGVLKSLSVQIPHQLKGFRVVDCYNPEQPVTLRIEKIDDSIYKLILRRNELAAD